MSNNHDAKPARVSLETFEDCMNHFRGAPENAEEVAPILEQAIEVSTVSADALIVYNIVTIIERDKRYTLPFKELLEKALTRAIQLEADVQGVMARGREIFDLEINALNKLAYAKLYSCVRVRVEELSTDRELP